LELAKMKLFSTKNLAVSRTNYLNSGGIAKFDTYIKPYSPFFRIVDDLAQRILFHCHSLTQDGVFNEFELIVCRNVLIYFEEETQQKVLRCFANSLHNDGFLLLGPQDGLQSAAKAAGFVPYRADVHLYKLQANGNHRD
jgi:chemotaxis protein methyltransferase CheR